MKASPGAISPLSIGNNQPSVKPFPAMLCTPQWEQLPAEKQQELTQVLAEMLLRQIQAQEGEVQHEQPS